MIPDAINCVLERERLIRVGLLRPSPGFYVPPSSFTSEAPTLRLDDLGRREAARVVGMVRSGRY